MLSFIKFFISLLDCCAYSRAKTWCGCWTQVTLWSSRRWSYPVTYNAAQIWYCDASTISTVIRSIRSNGTRALTVGIQMGNIIIIITHAKHIFQQQQKCIELNFMFFAEFFGYVPKETPQFRVFPWSNFTVHVSESFLIFFPLDIIKLSQSCRGFCCLRSLKMSAIRVLCTSCRLCVCTRVAAISKVPYWLIFFCKACLITSESRVPNTSACWL